MYDTNTLLELLENFDFLVLKRTISKAIKVLVILFGIYLTISIIAAVMGFYTLFGIWYLAVGG